MCRYRWRGAKSSTTSGDPWNIGDLRDRLDALEGNQWVGCSKCRQRITVIMQQRPARAERARLKGVASYSQIAELV
uniref:Uncharacterized protein n=1 Tax=Ralstonia solanacearum TaxID=305 RepID=A0A0S4VRC9_RALSL|nr:protein of unknown function [Ralstonia solanacearum]CUV37126.1 protein of unknown function [Ralstonia solanacearum]CUV42474.1 protein of unknown function [Ralstonia solanacearum]CUV61313.1 protein of unknown function [Ralstonia solanacearum]